MSSTCKRCGASGLVWKETQHGWRLHNGRDFHSCTALDAVAHSLSQLPVSQWDPANELKWRRKQLDTLATFLCRLSEDPDLPKKFVPLINAAVKAAKKL